MRNACTAVALVLVTLISWSPLAAQTEPASSAAAQISDASASEPPSTQLQFPEDKTAKSEAEKKAERMQEKERQKQRWQDIKRRSEKLLELATELKQYVDKSGESIMSVEVIKKAQEIEKLSKDLQKKMKGD